MKFFSKNGLILTVAVLFMNIASANKAEKKETESIPVDNKTYTVNDSTDLQTAQILVNPLRNPHSKVQAQAQIATKNKDQFPQNINNPVYTAHGKTDRKTAELLINLLRNPHLKVQAQAQIATSVKTRSPQNINNPVYIARGKTDKRTAQMLVNLLRNPHLRVKAEVYAAARENEMRFSISGKTNVETIKKLEVLLQNNKQVNITVQANSKTGTPINLNANIDRPPQRQQYLYQDYSAIIAQGQPFYHNGRPPVFVQGNTLWYPVQVTTQSPSGTQVQKLSE